MRLDLVSIAWRRVRVASAAGWRSVRSRLLVVVVVLVEVLLALVVLVPLSGDVFVLVSSPSYATTVANADRRVAIA